MNWWQRLRNRDRLERELDAELRDHLEREVTDYLRMGMSEGEARRRARLDLGGEDVLKESCRDARGTRWVSDTGQDVRVAARLLLKDRWFMLPAVLTLALGIGMNGTMFAIVSAMTRGLPIDRPDLIVSLHARDAAGQWRGRGVSYQDFRDFQHATTTFAGLAAFNQARVALSEPGRAAERTSATYLSANTLQLLKERPILGRDFSSQDDTVGAAAVVILSNRLWTSRYNADPAVIGRSVLVDGARTTIIGVMPEGFRFPVVSDAWLPLARQPGLPDDARDERTLQVFGRLAEHSSVARAQADVEAVASRLSREYPATNARTGAVLTAFPGPFAPVRILIALQIAVGLILLLASINVTKLLLARSIGRSGEFSLRAALGASRGRIIRQLLIESSILALPAGALGATVAMTGLWLFERAVSGITFPYYIRWRIDTGAGLFIAAACLITALLVGLLPALSAASAAVRRSLMAGLSASRSVARRRVTTLLLTIEVALTVVLLAGAGLMMRSFLAVYRADSIVDATRVAVLPIALAEDKYPTPQQRTAAFERLAERIDRLPGVWATAFASAVPFAGGPFRLLSRDGHPGAAGDVLPRV
jgi:predicted permease